MKKTILTIFTVLLISGSGAAQEIPSGAVVYSLPRTSIALKVEAQRDIFTAGPYAQYAEKYLGTPARQKNAMTCDIRSITLIPCVEADPAARYIVNVSDKSTSSAYFLHLSSQGLIMVSDADTGESVSWRFPSAKGSDAFIGKDPASGLTTAQTILFKTVKTSQGFERFAVQQSQIVESSLDRRAKEAAESIFNLRTRRVEIITGDTDATFSGEALEAAVNEINRLEEEYLNLFYGITESFVQETVFEVIPQKGSKQTYTAFKVSDELGLLPADAKDGNPITLQLEVEELSKPEISNNRGKDGSLVSYRVPVAAICRIMDEGELLLQNRIPVYQLGETLSFPIELLTTK